MPTIKLQSSDSEVFPVDVEVINHNIDVLEIYRIDHEGKDLHLGKEI